jgi:hypothetical protein
MADTLSLTALTLPSLPSHSAAFTCAHMDCSRSHAIVPVRVHVRVFLGLACPAFASGGVCVCDRGGWSVVSATRLPRVRACSDSCGPVRAGSRPYTHTHPLDLALPSRLALARRCSHPFAIVFGCLGLPVFIRAQSGRDWARRSCGRSAFVVRALWHSSSASWYQNGGERHYLAFILV